jgi:hypothetical protein
MAITAHFLKAIMAEARPIIERQMDDAKLISGFQKVVSAAGGDWGALKALIKAHVEDEADEAGDRKRIKKIVDKADDTAAYADMLGLANMNENNFSGSQSYAEVKGSKADWIDGFVAVPFNVETGEITDQEQPETDTRVGENVQVTTAARNDAGKQGVTAGETAPNPHSTAPAVEPEAAPQAPQSASGEVSDADIPAFIKRDYVLRPHCLNPSLCAGCGSKHCHACLKARDESILADEVAA